MRALRREEASARSRMNQRRRHVRSRRRFSRRARGHRRRRRSPGHRAAVRHIGAAECGETSMRRYGAQLPPKKDPRSRGFTRAATRLPTVLEHLGGTVNCGLSCVNGPTSIAANAQASCRNSTEDGGRTLLPSPGVPAAFRLRLLVAKPARRPTAPIQHAH